MSRRLWISLAFCGLIGVTSFDDASAAVLWYNGDVHIGSGGTGGGGTINEETDNRGSINIYDDFVVTDSVGWTVESVWSNNAMQVTGVTQASWSIRSGVSVGDGGTLIAGGFGAATQTPTGRVIPGLGFPEYTIEVSGLNVFLTPGTYWLSVSPYVGTETGSVLKSYNTHTLKGNAVGEPSTLNANSFLNDPFVGHDFIDAFGSDFSMGLAGVAASANVPEPGSLVLLGSVLLGTTCLRCRRRRSSIRNRKPRGILCADRCSSPDVP